MPDFGFREIPINGRGRGESVFAVGGSNLRPPRNACGRYLLRNEDVSKPDELAKVLAAQDWVVITKRIVLFAHRRLGCRSIEMARDVAQEALTRVWDPEYADWDPSKEPSLVRHLGSVVNGIIRNLNVSQRERVERPHSPDALEQAVDEGGKPTADGGSPSARIDACKILDRFLERTAEDKLASGIILLMADGVDKPSEQAVSLGVPVKDVYNARRRLNEHVGPVRAEFKMEVGDDL